MIVRLGEIAGIPDVLHHVRTGLGRIAIEEAHLHLAHRAGAFDVLGQSLGDAAWIWRRPDRIVDRNSDLGILLGESRKTARANGDAHTGGQDKLDDGTHFSLPDEIGETTIGRKCDSPQRAGSRRQAFASAANSGSRADFRRLFYPQRPGLPRPAPRRCRRRWESRRYDFPGCSTPAGRAWPRVWSRSSSRG